MIRIVANTVQCDAMWQERFLVSVLSGSDSTTPTNSGKENGTGNNELVKKKTKKLHHLAAHVEGSQPPWEIESTHPLLAHSLRFRLPVQAVVKVKALLL